MVGGYEIEKVDAFILDKGIRIDIENAIVTVLSEYLSYPKLVGQDVGLPPKPVEHHEIGTYPRRITMHCGASDREPLISAVASDPRNHSLVRGPTMRR